ncbi:sensor histidine kinase [Aquabacterium sp.]|uniref:sensor histidine kinase n=1 Tax=Aquabacterium sp. TaxID=1872578 RepID=UPI002BE1852D|nr:PAS domain-containing sensor histidine kinase [Aquabacterium sp.]HSW08593.1 PAS domain-containing sensor histidine kinase [Aquabacterium sp.]
MSTSTTPASPSSELLARAFNAAPNGFVLVSRDGVIVAANTALEAMFGHAPGTLVGQTLENLLPGALREAHVALRDAFFERPEPRAMGAGRVLYARRADGHEFPVEIGLNPLSGPQGPLVLASVVDISERLALEWAFRGLFDASPYGLLIVDDAGRIVMANRVIAESLGHTSPALVGQPLERLLPERYRGAHGALMAGYRRTGEARMMGRGRDLTALHADGSELPVEIGLSRVRWQRQTMTLAAVSDISVRKRLELELRQANANLQEFTYVASHDLRSPLRGIADLVEWINADLVEPPPEVQRNLDRISQRIGRMERLIDDLLSYARAGRAATEFTQVDLSALVRGILEMQPLPAGFEITLDLAVAPFPATRTPLETVLRNLLSNAVKHHDRAHGHIRVSARNDDSFCELSVTDDGPGVPETAKERIFKLFQTLTARERGSSGIGLALTKRLVEVHGGRIELVSPVQRTAEGERGTSLRFWWPRFPRRTSDEN